MSGEVRAWLDLLPGEERGVIARDGRFEHLIIHRESDPPQHRLGARSVGRISAVPAGLGAAFVELGAAAPPGFLPLRKGPRPEVGQKLEVEVAAEARESKGPVLRRLGPAVGEPRLLEAGPGVAEWLARLAPEAVPEQGLEALRIAREAEEEALAEVEVFAGEGVELTVQRTRALVAVDVDFTGVPGRDPARARARANAFALRHAARHVRLKGWGGLVCIDLAGTGHDGPAIAEAARQAFGAGSALGPLSRFGLLQLSLPWRFRPVEEILRDESGGLSTESRAVDLVRRARTAALADPATPRWTCVCNPAEATLVGPLLARLGPRFGLRSDSTAPPGAGRVEEG